MQQQCSTQMKNFGAASDWRCSYIFLGINFQRAVQHNVLTIYYWCFWYIINHFHALEVVWRICRCWYTTGYGMLRHTLYSHPGSPDTISCMHWHDASHKFKDATLQIGCAILKVKLKYRDWNISKQLCLDSIFIDMRLMSLLISKVMLASLFSNHHFKTGTIDKNMILTYFRCCEQDVSLLWHPE